MDGEYKMEKNDMCVDDGLVMPETRVWSKTKHKKIKYYFDLFSTSMKNKWKNRIYIDLFSSAGKAIIKETSEIIIGSPLLALSVKDKFDKYIFVEKEDDYFHSLQERVAMYFPKQSVSLINGDCNTCINTIISHVPQFSKENNGLSLCFLDPYNANQLSFNTIKAIADSLYVDFLVLIPSYMDINRNEHMYTRKDDTTLDDYLGTKEWRKAWENNTTHYKKFGLFIADYFCKRMKEMGYLYEDLTDAELIRMEIDQNLPLYHIAFFSRNKLGYRFWKDTKTNTTDQIDFCFDGE